MTKKWYNIELDPEEWAEFRKILQKDSEENGENWQFESSQAGELVHIEILCAPGELYYLNELLQKIW